MFMYVLYFCPTLLQRTGTGGAVRTLSFRCREKHAASPASSQALALSLSLSPAALCSHSLCSAVAICEKDASVVAAPPSFKTRLAMAKPSATDGAEP